jgi:hypothetical protein
MIPMGEEGRSAISRGVEPWPSNHGTEPTRYTARLMPGRSAGKSCRVSKSSKGSREYRWPAGQRLAAQSPSNGDAVSHPALVQPYERMSSVRALASLAMSSSQGPGKRPRWVPPIM